MAHFARDITEWVKLTKLSGSVVVRKLAFDGFRGILLRSPVDTGRFRASHRIGINAADLSAQPEEETRLNNVSGNDRFATAPTGSELGYAQEKLSGVEWGDSVHITNSLSYARKLEDGGSKQNGNQPDGIYGATFAELGAKLDAAIRSARDAARQGGSL